MLWRYLYNLNLQNYMHISNSIILNSFETRIIVQATFASTKLESKKIYITHVILYI